MSTELRWQRLQDLFHAACELPEQSREAFAHEHAGDDPQLLDELLAMIQIENSATRRVHEPLCSTRELIAAANHIAPGTRFGPWAVVRQIGRGGMGQVYLAHRADGAYQRNVALKVVGDLQMDAQQRAFFEVERQLLAQMDHPAIAQIHDAGSDDTGRPWLVMEYIEGSPITSFCEQAGMSLRQRIELFMRVCEGVMHAHQKGIVHRDIKPANVLVSQIDGVPVPKLIDFGIAMGISGGPVQPAGTPGYMAPEQLDPQQRSDSRSDIYSLGALLYEIVGGLRPPDCASLPPGGARPSLQLDTLDADDIQTLARRRGLAPRRLISTLRNELDWVIAQAMQPDPAARYSSVSLLSGDLQRFLDGYPVHAAPPRRSVAIRKFIARHRSASAAALLATAALLAGIGGIVWGLQKAEREAQRAVATADFLGTILGSVDPDVARDLDKTLMLKVLDEASRRVATELQDQPDAKIQVQFAIAESYTALGMNAQAIEHLESARETAIATHGRHSWTDLLAIQRMSLILPPEQAVDMLREAIPFAARHQHGSNRTLAPNLRSRMSWALRDLGRHGDALRESERAYHELRELVPPDHPQRLDAAQYLAANLADAGRFDEAIPMLREAIERRAETLGIDHPRTLGQRLSLAVFHLQKRDYAGGEAELKSMLEPVASQFGADSAMMMRVRNNLGGALRQQGKIEEAGPHYEFAYDYALHRNGPTHRLTLMTRHNHANWLLDAGHVRQALDEQLACLDIAMQTLGPDHGITSEILRGLGLAQIASHDLAGARQSLERSLAIKRAMYGDKPEPLARINEALALLQTAENQPPAVVELK